VAVIECDSSSRGAMSASRAIGRGDHRPVRVRAQDFLRFLSLPAAFKCGLRLPPPHLYQREQVVRAMNEFDLFEVSARWLSPAAAAEVTAKMSVCGSAVEGITNSLMSVG
jgi:hypothetical protein